MNNWAYTDNKPPVYWFGDKVYHRRIKQVGTVVGMRWTEYREPHRWVYDVRFPNFKKKKHYLAYEENLELR